MIPIAKISFEWLRENILKLSFPLTLPWIPLFWVADFLYRKFPEGNSLHNFIEILLVPGGLGISIFLSLVIYRLLPEFLSISQKVPLKLWLYALISRSVIVYLGLLLLTFILSLVVDPPPWNSENPQYIPLVFFTIVFYPPLLTPPIAIIVIWRSIMKKLENSL